MERKHPVPLRELPAGIEKTGLAAALFALNQGDTLCAARLQKTADFEQFFFAADVARAAALLLDRRQLLFHRKNLLKQLRRLAGGRCLELLAEQFFHVAVQAERHVMLPAGRIALHEFQI